VYGDYLQPPDLVEPSSSLVLVLEAKATRSPVGSTACVFCTLYDPRSGRYTFDYSIFFGIFAAILSLGATAVFIVRAWLDSRPSRRAT
jgi:hypothetical protein